MAFIGDKSRHASAGNQGGGTDGFFQAGSASLNKIIGISFSSSGYAEDWGSRTVARSTNATASTATHGYSMGGTIGSGVHYNVIDRFSFSSSGNATDVGNLTLTRSAADGAQSSTRGFTVGGSSGYATFTYNVIDAFTFASSVNASDWGDTLNLQGCSGGNGWAGTCYSSTNAYIFGGYQPCGGNWYNTNVISVFSTSSTSNASSWGTMPSSGGSSATASSSSYGFSIAGTFGDVWRIAFASGGASWCSLITGRSTGGGGSTHLGDDVLLSRYTSTTSTSVDKFSMASTSTATSWGDLSDVAMTGFEGGGALQMDA